MSSLGLIKAKLFFKVGELLFLYFPDPEEQEDKADLAQLGPVSPARLEAILLGLTSLKP